MEYQNATAGQAQRESVLQDTLSSRDFWPKDGVTPSTETDKAQLKTSKLDPNISTAKGPTSRGSSRSPWPELRRLARQARPVRCFTLFALMEPRGFAMGFMFWLGLAGRDSQNFSEFGAGFGLKEMAGLARAWKMGGYLVSSRGIIGATHRQHVVQPTSGFL